MLLPDFRRLGARLGPGGWGILLGLLAAAVAGGLLWQQARRSERDRRLESQTAAVVRQDVVIRVSATGVIRPITPVNISPKQPGRISRLYVDQGDRVQRGQVLARMDDSNLRGELLTAQGNLQAARANLRKMEDGSRPEEIRQARQNLRDAEAQMIAVRSTYQSNQALYRYGAIGRVAFDGSRSQYLALANHIKALQAQLDLVQAGFRREDIEAARGQLRQAEGALETVRTQIDDTVIRAPFAGVITQKYADVGAFVTPTTSASATSSATSSSIFAMAGPLEGMANVAETDIRSIYPGQSVNLQVDAYPGRIFHGKVRLIAPESVVLQNVTSFQVRITPTPDVGQPPLMSGMNFTANFLVGKHPNALLIPTPSIVSQEGGTGVYVLSPERRPVFRRVKVGSTVGAMTEVVSGLRAGERVFLSFPGQRRPNDRPVRPSSPFQQPGGGGRQIR
ncbi:MAG: RND transporter [Cyanobium sp. CACIAM 14]|nr:MAG: RND transporter [Cyanobium sp. CACIAM 14]